MTPADLEALSRERIRDSEVLIAGNCYAGAIYLCGYAVECAFKARICRTLGWKEFRLSGDYKILKTHDLVVLLGFSGIEHQIMAPVHVADWSVVKQWTEQMRYENVTVSTQERAEQMLQSTENMLHLIL